MSLTSFYNNFYLFCDPLALALALALGVLALGVLALGVLALGVLALGVWGVSFLVLVFLTGASAVEIPYRMAIMSAAFSSGFFF